MFLKDSARLTFITIFRENLRFYEEIPSSSSEWSLISQCILIRLLDTYSVDFFESSSFVRNGVSAFLIRGAIMVLYGKVISTFIYLII